MKYALVLIGALSVSGCAQMLAQQQAQIEQSYRDIEQCDSPDLPPEGAVNREAFADALGKQAMYASADKFVMDNKMQQLQYVGWNDSVASSVGACYRSQRQARIDAVKGQFESLKSSTKGKDERGALISAYSAWEAYMANPSDNLKSDFQSKLSLYKNI
ncbi:TPA: hypothetical protein NPN74_001577 [Klebsiella quasipneumoniae subsp. quasipneumoniae]|nr:hypothetical protein [Klebsiella quasipneumoniae subsp. quasipneumoniae]